MRWICHRGTPVDHAMSSLSRAFSGRMGIYTKSLHVGYRKPLYIPGPLRCRGVDYKDPKIKSCGYGVGYRTPEGFLVRSQTRI